jgi:hypothetical protein
MIEAREPVYKNVGRARTISILLGLDFIEKFDALENPYDLIIMESYECNNLCYRIQYHIKNSQWNRKYLQV